MNFSAMMETVGNGMLAPGFMGHSKCNIGQRKFLTGDGGLLRLVWMPRRLKAELEDRISLRGAELGCPDLIQKIADETIGIIEEDVLSYLKSVNHPALSLKPIIG
jgi:acetyl-CoA synthase